MENLRTLVLDLSVNFLTSSGELVDGLHIWLGIGVILGTLRTLQLRMPNICATF
ncbi:hypothetical protein B0J13DRAFT_564564 [Dactylonectria estremocensis]|uniref:Uncharacterized protein n=1 Tax=Dactylonectria estremocensis TaxID=1079267 RepID=A0A9P9DYM0_9HYPO|nr:hypothetical protein B0J13DRAFT_564564 [Dactylonectria estremocensis]